MTRHASHLGDELAQRHVDGTLDEAKARACVAHVAVCDACRLTVESYRALGAALAALETPDAGPAFTHGVLARIEEEERLAAWERRTAAAVAVVAALTTLGIFAAAGGSGWVQVLSGWSAALGEALHGAAVATDVAAPLLRALRLQILIGCTAVALPLLAALRRLAVREIAPPVHA